MGEIMTNTTITIIVLFAALILMMFAVIKLANRNEEILSVVRNIEFTLIKVRNDTLKIKHISEDYFAKEGLTCVYNGSEFVTRFRDDFYYKEKKKKDWREYQEKQYLSSLLEQIDKGVKEINEKVGSKQ